MEASKSTRWRWLRNITDWFLKVRKRSAALLSLYGSSAIMVFAYQAGAWQEWIANPLQLSSRTTQLTVAGALWTAFPFCVLLFAVVYVITAESAHRQERYGNTQYYRKMGLTSPAEIASLINTVAFLGLSLIVWSQLGILTSWVQIGYTVAAGAVFGLCTFYLIDSPASETPAFRASKPESKREALKLQAEFFRDLVQITAIGSVSIFVLVLTYLVFQTIQSLPKEALSLPSTSILLIDVLIVTTYFAIGIWGLISEFMRRYERTILTMLET